MCVCTIKCTYLHMHDFELPPLGWDNDQHGPLCREDLASPEMSWLGLVQKCCENNGSNEKSAGYDAD